MKEVPTSSQLVLIRQEKTASDLSPVPSPHRIVVATPDHPYVYVLFQILPITEEGTGGRSYDHKGLCLLECIPCAPPVIWFPKVISVSKIKRCSWHKAKLSSQLVDSFWAVHFGHVNIQYHRRQSVRSISSRCFMALSVDDPAPPVPCNPSDAGDIG